MHLRRSFVLRAAALAVVLACGPAEAAPQPAASSWMAAPGLPSANQQLADTATLNSIASLREGPAKNTYTSNNYGDAYTSYYGTVNNHNTSSGATNAINTTDVSSSVSGSAGATITVSTGQTSGTADQSAVSKILQGSTINH